MPTTIRLRRGTAAQWTTANPVLAAGEPGHETDTGKHKIGDGSKTWSQLEYFLPESALSATIAAGTGVLHIEPGKKGVVGNGTGDDTAAMQAILDEVDPAEGVTTVVVHSGTYMIDAVNETPATYGMTDQNRNAWAGGGLRPKSGTNLILAPDAVLKVIPNGSPGYAAIYVGPTSVASGSVLQNDIRISGGQILCDRATHDYVTSTTYTNHEWGYGIVVKAADNVVIENMTITGATGDAITLGSLGLDPAVAGYVPCTHIMIRHCTLDASRRNNVSIGGTETATIEDCRILNAGIHDGVHDGIAPRWGVDLEFSTAQIAKNISVRNNTFVGNVDASLGNYNAGGVTFEGNFCDNAIFTGSHAELDTVVRGNVIINRDKTTGYGISVGASVSVANVIVADNLIIGFDTSIAAHSPNVIVSGNYCSEFTTIGISAYTAVDTAITGNMVVGSNAGTTQYGIRVQSATRLDIVSNTIVGCWRAIGLTTLNNTAVSIRNNAIRRSVFGVHISTSSSVTVSGNNFNTSGHGAGQDWDVVWTVNTTTIVASHNVHRSSFRCYSGANDGLVSPPRIAHNDMVDVASASVYPISLGAGRHEVIGNALSCKLDSGNLFAAIQINGSASGSVVTDNTITTTGSRPLTYAIDVAAATGTLIAGNKTRGAGTLVNPGTGNVVSDNVMLDRIGTQTKTAAYTAIYGDLVLANATTAAFTVTSPATVKGATFSVRKTDASANAVTVAPASGTIDGAASVSLATQGAKGTWVCDGTNWWSF